MKLTLSQDFSLEVGEDTYTGQFNDLTKSQLNKIIKKYDFLISPTYSPEEARERLKKMPFKKLISPSVEERLEAINIKKIGER